MISRGLLVLWTWKCYHHMVEELLHLGKFSIREKDYFSTKTFVFKPELIAVSSDGSQVFSR